MSTIIDKSAIDVVQQELGNLGKLALLLQEVMMYRPGGVLRLLLN